MTTRIAIMKIMCYGAISEYDAMRLRKTMEALHYVSNVSYETMSNFAFFSAALTDVVSINELSLLQTRLQNMVGVEIVITI